MKLSYCSWFLILALLTNLGAPFGEARELWQVEGSGFKTSDDISLRQFQMQYLRDPVDPYWPYLEQEERAWGVKAQWVRLAQESGGFVGGSRQGGRLLGHVRQLLGESWSFEGELGVDVLKDSGDQDQGSKMFGVGSLEALYYRQDQFWLSLRAGYELLYPRVLPLSGDLASTRAKTVQARGRWKMSPRLRLDVHHEVADFKALTQRQQTDIQWMWGAWTFPHWVWFGLGAESLRHSQTVGEFWSPDEFKALGLRWDVSLSLGPDWRLFTGGSLNRLREGQEGDWGRGYYLRAGGQRGDREGSLIRLYYEGNQSRQRGSTWSSHGLGAFFQF